MPVQGLRGRHAVRFFARLALSALGGLVVLLAVAASAAAQSNGVVTKDRQALVTVKGVANPFSSFGIVKRLRQVPGVKDVTFDLYTGQAIVTLEPKADIGEAELKEAVRNASYTAGKIQWREVGPKSSAVTQP